MTKRVYVWVLREEFRTVGAAVAQAWEEHGVPVTGPTAIELGSIAEKLPGSAGGVHLVIGGCGIDGSEPSWLREHASAMLESVPAVASLLWWREVGAVASRYAAAAGRVGDTLVVVMPGQLDLARSLTHDVLLGEVAHWLEGLGISSEYALPPSDDIAPNEAVPVIGWQEALAKLGAQPMTARPFELSDAWSSHAPLVDVLARAGQRGSVAFADGPDWGLWGFPDLLRPSSKILAIRETTQGPQLLAMHRRPQVVGTAGEGLMGLSRCSGEALRELVEAFGEGCPDLGDARLFACDFGEVWVERNGSVLRWDGRKLRDQGTTQQALATLALRWSSR